MMTATIHRIPDPYTPPEHIRATAAKLWAKIPRPDVGCWLWSGAKPNVWSTSGRYLSVFDVAYQALVDEIWPGLVPRPSCFQPACLRHLTLRRARNRPPATRELLAMVYAIEQSYRTRQRRSHRELGSVEQIAAAYEVPVAQVYEWYDEFSSKTIPVHRT